MGVRGFFKNTVEVIRRFFGNESDEDETILEVEPLDEFQTSQAIKEPFWLEGTTDSLPEGADPLLEQSTISEEPFWLDDVTQSLSEESAPLPEQIMLPDEGLITSEPPDVTVADAPQSKPKPKRSRRRSKKPDVIIISAEPKPVPSTIDLGIVNYPLDSMNEPVIDDATTDRGVLIAEIPDAIVIPAQPKPVISSVALEIVNHSLDSVDGRVADEATAQAELFIAEIPNAIVIPALPKPALNVVDLEIMTHSLDSVNELSNGETPHDKSATKGSISPHSLNGAAPSEYPAAMTEADSPSSLELEQPDEPTIHLNGASPNQSTPTHIENDSSQMTLDEEMSSTSTYIESGSSQMTLESALESLLFVAETPIDLEHLTKILDLPAQDIKQGIDTLDQAYAKSQRGLRIQDYEEKFQLVTSPSSASLVEDFLSFNLSTRLSGPALEALSIVAYRQPVTRAQVEAVRGVDCGSVMRSLIQLGLVEESGRLEALGRPILYSTTDFFMQHFGLLKMSDLPPLEVQEEEILDSSI